MIYKKIKYQLDAAEEISGNITRVLREDNNKKYIGTLNAFTASGKTVTINHGIAKIKEFCSKNGIDVAFVYMSPADGGQNDQNLKEMQGCCKAFDYNSINPVSMMDDRIKRGTGLQDGDIAFATWDGYVKKNNKSAREDGDGDTAKECIKKTKDKGIKIVLVIDEFDTDASTDKAMKFIEDLGPNYIQLVSATPDEKKMKKYESLGYNPDRTVKIDTDDVEKAQMIRKGFIGIDITDIDGRDPDEITIRACVKKRDELAKKYDNYKININPVAAFQIQNKDQGEHQVDKIKKILNESGSTVENGEVAIWLTDEKENLEEISLNNNKVKYVIFKAAIIRAHNNPRLQVLGMMRTIKTKPVADQLAGRFYRTPEQKHYEDNDLNYAYFFNANEEMVWEPESRLKCKVKLKSTIKTGVPKISIPSYSIKELDPKTIQRERDGKGIAEIFGKIFSDKYSGYICGDGASNTIVLKEHGWQVSNNSISVKMRHKQKIDIADVIHKNEPNNSGELISKHAGKEFVLRGIEETVSIALSGSYSNRSRSFDVLTQIVLDFITSNITGNADLSRGFFYDNKDMIGSIIKDDFLPKYDVGGEKARPTETTAVTYSIPEQREYDSELYDEAGYAKYAHDKCFLLKSRSQAEKATEKALEQDKNIEYWFKNPNKGNDALCLLKDGSTPRFIDYIATTGDGRIILIETKTYSQDQEPQHAQDGVILYKYC